MSPSNSLPVFAYWSGRDTTKISDMIKSWSCEFAQFRLFGDDDILPLLSRHFADSISTFQAIRIPAARADIARLLLLYEHGGLYVDCHCGIRDATKIRDLFVALEKIEHIFIDRVIAYRPRPVGTHFLLNTIIFARRRSLIMLEACRRALSNLADQRQVEEKYNFSTYHIGALTGPLVLNEVVFVSGVSDAWYRTIRSDLNGRVSIIPEDSAPIMRNIFSGYRGLGLHWSERQKHEPLFERVEH